jgi:hypothetical protein
MAYNKEKRQKYLEANKVKIAEQKKDYYKVNKNDMLSNQKEWREANKERQTKFRSDKLKNNNLHNIKCSIRTLIGNSFRCNRIKKLSKTELILGCSFEQLKQHIESQFESWMTWDNKGHWNGIPNELNVAWDIDHIEPLINAKTESDLIRLNHYTNLRPLCSYTNRYVKGRS